jgi:hypothetical protein
MPRPYLVLLLALTAAPAGAQSPRARVEPTPGQLCETLPDTARGPTPGQLAEIRELRGRLIAIGRRHGVTEPHGLLMVDVDSTRRGQLLFIESNYPDRAVRQATDTVAKYLESLPGGRGYQALLRVDGDYPARAPGRRHCRPDLLTIRERQEMLMDAVRRHPDAGRLPAPLRRQALLLLVVTRDGNVGLATLTRATGDA